MEHAFGSGDPFSVGIEEELFLVDPASGALVPAAADVLAAASGGEAAPMGYELYSTQLELRTRPAPGAAAAAAELERLREAARSAGATLLGAGLHPLAELGEVAFVDKERYRRGREMVRGLVERTPEAALHVHVGMPDPATAVRVHDELRAWLPLLAGLAAASPYWFGRDSGFASARHALVRAYPGRGVPDPIGEWREHERRVAAIRDAGGPDDYTLVWWDVRLHPRLGTVEVREMDAQPRVADAAALAALIRGLACEAAEAERPPAPREPLVWSLFVAARDGLGAEVLCEGELMPLREAARVALGRAAPHAAAAGDEEALAGVERILAGGSADRQRAAHANGGIAHVVASLRRETAGEADHQRPFGGEG